MPIPSFEGELVLVTGGAGFIGSHLVDMLLAQDARVRVLDNFTTGRRENLAHVLDRLELIEGDIRDADTCRRASEGVGVVFHQAALGSVPRSMKDPAATFAVNVQGTVNVFAAGRDCKVRRVVYASSSSVYGDSDRLPKREGEEGRPLSPYALSKVVNEKLADVFGRCYGMQLIGLRYFNVFGPRQSPTGPYAAVIPRFIDAMAKGERPVLYGSGEQSRDFTYVKDVVQANVLAAWAAPSAAGKVYNVASARAISIRSLAQVVAEALRVGITPREEPPRAGDVLHSLADISLAREHLGYEPQTQFHDGLRAAVAAGMDADPLAGS